MSKQNILIQTKKDDYSLKVVEESDGRLLWYMNDHLIMKDGIEPADDAFLCYQSALLTGNEKDIFVAGLGFGYTSEECAKIGNTTTLEILPEVIDFYKAKVPEPNHTIIEGDAYDFLHQTESTYDAILFQLDFVENILCKQSNSRFYTPEFFKILYSRLRSGGLFITEGKVDAGKKSITTSMLKDAGFSVEEDRMGVEGDLTKDYIYWIATKLKNFTDHQPTPKS